ncbi:hypothetical protein [Sinorhizobium americanum]|uniref:hypothetical protein n=1 Tax=Sinorhizobium americanum TaxID=194963 RepID=UPI001A9CFEFC|nr:hypothetical protein [Sinorhizobium americanum]
MTLADLHRGSGSDASRIVDLHVGQLQPRRVVCVDFANELLDLFDSAFRRA